MSSGPGWSPISFGRALHERRVPGVAAGYALLGFGSLKLRMKEILELEASAS